MGLHTVLTFAGLFVAGLSVASSQENWQPLAPTASDDYFVDTESLKASGSLVGARVKWFMGAGTLRIEDVEVDCSDRRMRVLRWESLSVGRRETNVRLSGTEATPDAPWRSYPKSSDGFLVADALCERALPAP